MSDGQASRIPCSKETRELVKSQKVGGETYDELLQKMAQNYDPEKANELAGDDDE